MLKQEDIDFFCERSGEPLHFIWGYIEDAYRIPPQRPDPNSFEERKNDFFF
ncbi:DUF596 domain-containing protein, partial [Xylella fastidiosa subsp. multiplex]|nr:DUF596 domain-containing protein [Xylella fastidiosa subsp. multiplex]